MKPSYIVFFFSAVLFLSGCSRKAGIVRTREAMTVSELYEQRHKYIGQVVTVFWDTTTMRTSGFNRFPKNDSLNSGRLYNLDAFFFEDLEKLGLTQEMIDDSIKNHILKYHSMDPCPDLDLGSRQIGIIRDYEKENIVKYPDWIADSIKNKYSILQIKQTGKLSKIFSNLGYGKKNWVTGVFIGFYEWEQGSWEHFFPELPPSKCETVSYTANIIPIGMKVSFK